MNHCYGNSRAMEDHTVTLSLGNTKD